MTKRPSQYGCMNCLLMPGRLDESSVSFWKTGPKESRMKGSSSWTYLCLNPLFPLTLQNHFLKSSP